MTRAAGMAIALVLLASLGSARADRGAYGQGSVSIHADEDAVARAAADTLVSVVNEARAEGRRATVALSGGSTPRRLFSLLAGEYRHRVDWDAVEIFFGDERAVAPTQADSNYGTAQALWLSRVGIPPARVHRMRAEALDLEAAARSYEETVRARVAGRGEAGAPRFDLVWLGLGSDGHTASLFPGGAGLRARRRLVVVAEGAGGQRRLSFSRVLLAEARRLQFLVTGADKAAVLARVHAASSSATLPAAQVVAAAAGRVQWLVDRPAAARLGAVQATAPRRR